MHTYGTILRQHAAVADAVCCARLQAVNFNSNLPVVIIDPLSNITQTKGPAQVCVCTNGQAIPALSGACEVTRKGGTTTSEAPVVRELSHDPLACHLSLI